MKSSPMTKAGRPPGSRSRRGRWTSRVEARKIAGQAARLPVPEWPRRGSGQGPSPSLRPVLRLGSLARWEAGGRGPGGYWHDARRPAQARRPPPGIARKSHAERAGEGLGRGPVPSRGPAPSPAPERAHRGAGPPAGATSPGAALVPAPRSKPSLGSHRGCSLAGRCYCQSHVITASSVPFRVSLFKAPGLICLVSPQLT